MTGGWKGVAAGPADEISVVGNERGHGELLENMPRHVSMHCEG